MEYKDNDDLEMEELEDEDASEELTEESPEESISNEVDEVKNQLIRLQADFANYKKRQDKDRELLKYMAIERFVEKLLPVMDNFERAMDSAKESDVSLYEGVKMIYDQMVLVLKDNGVEMIDPLGEQFDPNFHHAIAMEKCEEEHGVIIDVLQTGYMLKDKVIRPATVRVAE
ncbi:MAG: nucleotide exchange factor GrpE [Tissierellia bacterium]|nr:nucleotide exchange factor GrpE [Tissierellia bacterium]